MEPSLQYRRGIELFNAGQYFECHEVLEELWLAAQGAEREFLHAVIQAAVALHHYQRGNLKGAASVYERSRRKLGQLPQQVMGLDTIAFARELDAFFSAALASTGPSSLPHIQLQDG
jgi:hypothetical protein